MKRLHAKQENTFRVKPCLCRQSQNNDHPACVRMGKLSQLSVKLTKLFHYKKLVGNDMH